MIDLIRKELNPKQSREKNIQSVREFLQILLLKILFDEGGFKYLAFVGGTALRVLYGLKRFSEDLDFSLIYSKGYDFQKLCTGLERTLKSYGLSVEGKPQIQKTVQQVMLKFEGLLQTLSLSNLASQKLFIRVEVDSNPPHGAHTEVSLNNRTFTFNLTHYDLSSLFAAKLHACFFRKYTKGRDFYDLYWYLGKRIKPNFVLLNRAIEQTEKVKMNMGESNFYDFLKEKLVRIDFHQVRKDVERFLEDRDELRFLNQEALLSLAKQAQIQSM